MGAKRRQTFMLRNRPWTQYIVAHMVECFRCSSDSASTAVVVLATGGETEEKDMVANGSTFEQKRRRAPSSCLRFLAMLLEEEKKKEASDVDRSSSYLAIIGEEAAAVESRNLFYDHLRVAIATSADPWILPAIRFATAMLSSATSRRHQRIHRRPNTAATPQSRQHEVKEDERLRVLELAVDAAIRSWELSMPRRRQRPISQSSDANTTTHRQACDRRLALLTDRLEFWIDANEQLRQRDQDRTHSASSVRSNALPLLRTFSSLLKQKKKAGSGTADRTAWRQEHRRSG